MLLKKVSALITASALATRPEYAHALREHVQAMKATDECTFEEVYEAFLQLYLFVGFPAALEALRALSHAFGVTHDRLSDDMNYDHFTERGMELYTRIYSRNAVRVREEMLKLSPELAQWALVEGYGKTLSRLGLEVQTRELCIVAILTQLAWKRQLFSHILGAHNVGASKEDILDAITIGAMGDDGKQTMAEQLLQKITYSPST